MNEILDKEGLLLPRIPVSTYRLQFNSKFKFLDVKDIIGYLHDLGISDIYASPYLKAKKNSMHGYDIVDPTVLNPEIGTKEEYDELIKELHKYDMGHILDIVPNHMCIECSDNMWWMDVLENGQSSIYAHFFDIEWQPVKDELKNKILTPILGDYYGNVLERQELILSFERGAFFINYFGNKFPVRPETYNMILEYRIEELKNLLSDKNPDFVELLSIVTALKHLPPYTETDGEKIIERKREKEVVKNRLRSLYSQAMDIKAYIDENVQIFNGMRNEPKSFDLLDKLLSEQVYRFSNWRVAAEEINYRRFFDINSLGAIRMEDIDVFNETHKLIFKLIKERKITGLRVDHPDGLYDPSEYFKRLQKKCFIQVRLGFFERMKETMPLQLEKNDVEAELSVQYDEALYLNEQYKPFYIVGEKVLIRSERIPEEWLIFSTTGYFFMNSVNGIFVDTKNAKAFENIYTKFIKTKINFQDIVYERKKMLMQEAMSSEINTLGHYLNLISEKSRHTRDLTLNSLIKAIIEVIAFFPVYRTYINSRIIKERDRQYIEYAISKAKRHNRAISESIFNFLMDVFLLNFPEDLEEEDKKEWLDIVMRFQQLTGPVMAKGLEDTAFYIYNRLVSLNEVGGYPERFGTTLEAFHGQNIDRIKYWPHALIATSTHDSKRSEDVRARINVLSEFPEEWKKRLNQWSRLNKKKRMIVDGQIAPDLNEEYFIYQTLIGAWPLDISDESEYEIFKKRIKDYILKAIRESKVNTSWINPNLIYEEAMIFFIESILNDIPDNQFLEDFKDFQKVISYYGVFNSLSQTLLKITSPGVPDHYQGTEIWDFSLVDPDNRRPVDYGVRIKMLKELINREKDSEPMELLRELTNNPENGMIKLYIKYKALNYRKANRELFEKGEYLPLEAYGEGSECVCAFARRQGNREAIVVVPRFLTRLIPNIGIMHFGAEVWKNSFIVVPIAETGVRYTNIFTSEMLNVYTHSEAKTLLLSEVFANSPVALLEGNNG